jgi:hypothetical protein
MIDTSRHGKRIGWTAAARVLVFLFPFVFCAAWLGLKKIPNVVYYSLIREDGPLENLEALFFFAGGILSWLAARRFRRFGSRGRAVFFGLLGAAMVLAGLEEISWGQRIFHLRSTGFFDAHNTQDETNLHNLDCFRNLLPLAYIAAGLAGSLGWLAARLASGGRLRRGLTDCAPDPALAFYFVPVFCVYLFFELACRGMGGCVIGGFVQWRDQEPAEFLMALGLLGLALRARLESPAPRGR